MSIVRSVRYLAVGENSSIVVEEGSDEVSLLLPARSIATLVEMMSSATAAQNRMSWDPRSKPFKELLGVLEALLEQSAESSAQLAVETAEKPELRLAAQDLQAAMQKLRSLENRES